MSALAAVVDPKLRGHGLSARVIQEMGRIAARHGFSALVAPVRPTLKGRYPLVPMARYIRWRAPGGGPFEPRLRVHWPLCARAGRLARPGMVGEVAPGALDPLTKELLSLAVSAAHSCEYCIHSHTASARKAGMTEAMLGELLAVVGMASETNALADAYQIPVDERFRM